MTLTLANVLSREIFLSFNYEITAHMALGREIELRFPDESKLDISIQRF
jgi:hypothetical protein